MGAVTRYIKKEFQVRKLYLEHDNASLFYLSCLRRNVSIVPLLCAKIVLFLGCVAILLVSMILLGMSTNFWLWFIYLTHWGLTFNTLAAGFSLAVSLDVYKNGPVDATFGLPWYVKMYWGLYDISITIAIFITIYYWSLLSSSAAQINQVLDIFVHAVNSVLMLLLLFSSRQPAHLLHFYLPLCAGLVYIVFTVIYYFAGGLGIDGSTSIYPMLDWSDPGPTMVMVVISAVAIILVHILVVALTVLRNYVTKRFRRDDILILTSLPVTSSTTQK